MERQLIDIRMLLLTWSFPFRDPFGLLLRFTPLLATEQPFSLCHAQLTVGACFDSYFLQAGIRSRISEFEERNIREGLGAGRSSGFNCDARLHWFCRKS